MAETVDFLVIGAGIAGASAAALLARHGSVLLVEGEDRPGYHSTGRSAATWLRNYGPPQVRALTRASRPFFDTPPDGFADHPLLRRRGALLLAAEGEEALIGNELADGVGLERISGADCEALVPALKPGKAMAGVYDADAHDMDVDLILQGFLRLLKQAGGRLLTGAPVTALSPEGQGFRVTAGTQSVSAGMVVNAAGAWADTIAALAGVRPLGIQPRRRSIAVIDPAPQWDSGRWPLTAALDMSFYVRPDAGRLLVSPADARPVEAHDAFADDFDIALGIDRMQGWLDIPVRRVEHRWAGLRSFSPDGSVVSGPDPDRPGFYWLAGQGGYGIQSCVGMAMAAEALATGAALPPELTAEGVAEEALSPARFLS